MDKSVELIVMDTISSNSKKSGDAVYSVTTGKTPENLYLTEIRRGDMPMHLYQSCDRATNFGYAIASKDRDIAKSVQFLMAELITEHAGKPPEEIDSIIQKTVSLLKSPECVGEFLYA